MNCYTHQELPALGICKHFQKGICHDCLQNTGVGIACKGICGEEVNAIHEHNKSVIGQTRGSFTSTGLFYTALGGVFLIGPLLYFRKIDPVLICIGSLLLAYGIYILTKSRAISQAKRTNF